MNNLIKKTSIAVIAIISATNVYASSIGEELRFDVAKEKGHSRFSSFLRRSAYIEEPTFRGDCETELKVPFESLLSIMTGNISFVPTSQSDFVTRTVNQAHIHVCRTVTVDEDIGPRSFQEEVTGKEAFLESTRKKFGEKLTFTCKKSWNSEVVGWTQYEMFAHLPASMESEYSFRRGGTSTVPNYMMLFSGDAETMQGILDERTPELFATIAHVTQELEKHIPLWFRSHYPTAKYEELSTILKGMVSKENYEFAQTKYSELKNKNWTKIVGRAGGEPDAPIEVAGKMVADYLESLAHDRTETSLITIEEILYKFGQQAISDILPTEI